jgi:transcriptional regulator with XRE-family HTH domain
MPKRPRFIYPLRKIRIDIGLSQQKFADLIGCSTPTVQALENGRMPISTALEQRIFVGTGADMKELIKGRKGKALDQNGQPYSNEFYQSWKERQENYDSKTALKDFESLLAAASQQGKLREVLVHAQGWFYDCREALREMSQG